jgi:limonene 1,2-monooxygenase
VQGDTAAEIIANNRESGFAVIGTPDDAVAKIEELIEASDGGFGAFLLFDHAWAPPAAKLQSYELFAQYVIPHFTGQLAGPAASCDWVTASGTEFVDRAAHAIGRAISDHAAEQQAKHAPAGQ